MATGVTDSLANLGHPYFEIAQEIAPAQQQQQRRRRSSVKPRIVTYPEGRLGVPNWFRDIVSKMLAVEPIRRAELIEVAAKVPKEIAAKETRPLMELAWMDYKQHVGPLAGSDTSFGVSSSASSLFSGISNMSNPLQSLLGHRRRSSAKSGSYKYA